MASRLHLTIASRLEEIALVGCSVHAVGRHAGLTEEAAQDLELATVEALNNVVEHAHRGRPDLPVEVVLEVMPDRIAVDIVDHGTAMPAERLAEPVSLAIDPADIDSLEESGRGIALMQMLVDEIGYVAQDDTNRLRLTKLLC